MRREVGGRELYRDLSLELEVGSVIAVRGRSGAGKSQFLRQLAGLDPEVEGSESWGEMTLDGRTPHEWGAQAWRAEVSYIPQVVPPMPGTPLEFAERIADLRVQRERDADDPLDLGRSWGLVATQWSSPWNSLSVGERQRALLAVQLARNPAILLLDEPTASLDTDSIAAVEETLMTRTCIWVTHQPEQARRVAEEVLWIGGESDA